MGRDHSIECTVCGVSYGGFLGDEECDCDRAGRDAHAHAVTAPIRIASWTWVAIAVENVHRAALETLRARAAVELMAVTVFGWTEAQMKALWRPRATDAMPPLPYAAPETDAATPAGNCSKPGSGWACAKDAGHEGACHVWPTKELATGETEDVLRASAGKEKP